MKQIKNASILLREKLDQSSFNAINQLRLLCVEADGTALKLELDYKLNMAQTDTCTCPTGKINEFMYYAGQELVGYIGICHFGGDSLEVNGMVHPDYRRKGVFKRLFSLALDEWHKRDIPKMLLLSDRMSEAGLAFIGQTSAGFEHAEHEMYLNHNTVINAPSGKITLRKANNSDAVEITEQNACYFGIEFSDMHLSNPEEEEKRGMMIYLAEMDGPEGKRSVIGKIHLELNGTAGAIFGFGVKPEFRRKGYGREILALGIDVLKAKKPRNIFLQVAVMNENALNLYKSCGFEVTSTMDYYMLKK